MSQPHENYTPTKLALIDRIDATLSNYFFGASEIGIVLVSWFAWFGFEMMKARGG